MISNKNFWMLPIKKLRHLFDLDGTFKFIILGFKVGIIMSSNRGKAESEREDVGDEERAMGGSTRNDFLAPNPKMTFSQFKPIYPPRSGKQTNTILEKGCIKSFSL